MPKESDTIKRKPGGPVLDLESGGELPYLVFPSLRNLKNEEGRPLVTHLFTTRLGGVSTGAYDSLNMLPGDGDDAGNVRENYRRIARVMDAPPERFVLACQRHTNNVLEVGEQDAGRGLTRPLTWDRVDGLITQAPELVLSVFFADCTPLFFVDPVHRAIGLSHSGWRGTAARIGRVTVESMVKSFGTDPADLVCAIGPSICRECYEVGEEVAEQFAAGFAGREDEILEDRGIVTGGDGKRERKFHLDLWAANRIVLEESGVPSASISVTDMCTCCNPGWFFSHRAAGPVHGEMGGFIKLNALQNQRF